jgi:pyruvate formate lyase activating enzyme
MVIERDWFQLGQWNLQKERCAVCGYAIAGHFEAEPGKWGARRLPVRLKEF